MATSEIGGRSYGTSATEVDDRQPVTTSIPSSVASVQLVARNDNRRGLTVMNISASKLYLSYSTPATVNNCFVVIPAEGFLLLDQQLICVNAIYGYWDTSSGFAQVTEYM